MIFENYGISDGITKKQRQIASNSSLPILSKALILLRSRKVEHRGIEPLTSRLRNIRVGIKHTCFVISAVNFKNGEKPCFIGLSRGF